MFTWFVLAMLGVANYIRIINGSLGTQGCHEAYAAAATHRRLSDSAATTDTTESEKLHTQYV